MLALFLLEVGLVTGRRFGDLKAAGWKLILFALLMLVVALTGWLAWRERLLRPPVLAATVLLLGALAIIVVPEIQDERAPDSERAQPAAAPAAPTASDKIVVESVTPLMVPSVPAPAAAGASAAPGFAPTPARPAASQPAASAARQP